MKRMNWLASRIFLGSIQINSIMKNWKKEKKKKDIESKRNTHKAILTMKINYNHQNTLQEKERKIKLPSKKRESNRNEQSLEPNTGIKVMKSSIMSIPIARFCNGKPGILWIKLS